MAQLDTGLGWSADDAWLHNQSQYHLCDFVIAEHPDFPGQPIPWDEDLPVNEASIEINNMCAAEGMILAYGSNSYPNGRVMAIANKPGCFVAYNPNNQNLMVFSPTYNARIWIGVWRSFPGTRYDYRELRPTSGPSNSVYYNSSWVSTFGGWTTNVWPTLNKTPVEYCAGFELDTTHFYKLNAGYAVASFTKWITPEGVEQISPILISTDENAVKLSNDGTTEAPYVYTNMQRYDGLTFYMSMVINQRGTAGNIDINTADLTQFAAAAPSKVFAILATDSFANIVVTETVDPYEDFGYTEEDAGEINPDPQDDDIDFDDLPTKSFASAGFCRIYNPDISDLNDLANYMWTDQSFLQTVINHLKQILENPIEAIISLSMVPVQPPVGSSKVPVNVMFISTGVSMRPVTSQFVTIDCGTTILQECYGGALDYNPYTRVQIYLPYIGTVQLDTDEVMAKTLHLQYHIDVVTGICCAEIKADNKLLYSFSGHCAVSQPITSADFSSYLNAAVAAAKVAVGVATGMASTTAGAAAAELPPAVPSKPQSSTALVPLQSSGPIGPHLGSPGLSGSRGWTDFSDIPEPQSSGGTVWGELAKPGNVNTVASAMGGKMVVQHSGGFSGNSGYLAKRRPYLIVIRPRIANPKNYAQHFGRTSMEYLNLGSCTGYTKVQSVHLSGFDATNPELSEISSLLKGGVLM